jgi:hypothetical protein
VGLLRGVEKGRQFIMDPANKAAAVNILVTATNTSEIDALRTYDEFTRYARYFTPQVDVEGYRVMMQHLHERGDIDRVDDPMNYIDLSYLREALGG